MSYNEMGPGPFAWPLWIIIGVVFLFAQCGQCQDNQDKIDRLEKRVKELEENK